MTNLSLPQAEAERLIAIEKVRADDEHYSFPGPGERLNIPVISRDRNEHFHLDITRGRINIIKCSFQNRSQGIIILVRLCLQSAPHRNPDGTRVSSSHIHVYQEGYGDAWAYELHAMPEIFQKKQKGLFSDTENLYNTLEEFTHLCNITEPPFIDPTIFT